MAQIHCKRGHEYTPENTAYAKRDGARECRACNRAKAARHYKPRRRPTLEQRFWSKVERSESCWLWRGTILRPGYGMFWTPDAAKPAHRVAYELTVGPIPDGLVLDHLCRVRNCVNPAHLEPVTHRTNILRGVGAGAQHAAKTHCKNGHPFSGENLLITRNGARACRACQRAPFRQRKAS